jgi:hypothetical protein
MKIYNPPHSPFIKGGITFSLPLASFSYWRQAKGGWEGFYRRAK